MLKTVTVTVDKIKKNDRFEPNFWVIKDFINNVLSRHKRKKISEYSKFIKKGIFDLRVESYRPSGIPFLRIGNLQYFELGTENLVYISEKDNKANSKTILRHGDIAFSKIGTLGKMLRIGKRFPEVNISQNLIGVGFKDSANKNYIFAYLLSKLALLQIKKNKKKQLQDKLNLNDIGNIEIIELPEPQMRNISELVQKAEEKAENSISILKQAQNFFYKNLDVNFLKIQDEKTYSINLSDFVENGLWNPTFSYRLYVDTLKAIQEKWQTVSLDEIATAKKGNEVGSGNYNKYLDKIESDIPFIRTSDLVNCEVDQFPDFYIPEKIYQELKQDIEIGDILFSNDGKIGLVAMLTSQDKVIIQSHIKRLRLRTEAKKYNLTPEYLFLVLTIKEIAKYQAKRYTVIQSTIPTIANHLLDFQIPILDKISIDEITKLVKEAFELKDEKKKLIKEVREEIDSYFDI